MFYSRSFLQRLFFAPKDTITQQAGALRQHQVAGKVVDPESDQPVEGVEPRPFRNNYPGDMGGSNKARSGMMYFPNEELFGTPESSKSLGRQ